MSTYKIIKCKVDTRNDVVASLKALGCPESAIEVYDTPQPLLRYEGSKSGRANVIVRREWLNGNWSHGASNDLGFEETKDEILTHISDYDVEWWKNKEPQFLQYAAREKVIREAKKKGYVVKEKVVDGNICLELKMTY